MTKVNELNKLLEDVNERFTDEEIMWKNCKVSLPMLDKLVEEWDDVPAFDNKEYAEFLTHIKHSLKDARSTMKNLQQVASRIAKEHDVPMRDIS